MSDYDQRFVYASLCGLLEVAAQHAAGWNEEFIRSLVDVGEYALATDELADVFLGLNESLRTEHLPTFRELAAQMDLLSDPEYQATAEILGVESSASDQARREDPTPMTEPDKPPSMLEEIEAFCREAEEDGVGLWQIVEGAKDRGQTEEALHSEVFHIIRVLLERGLLACNLADDLSFTPWQEQRPDHVINRVRQEWQELGCDPAPWDIGAFRYFR